MKPFELTVSFLFSRSWSKIVKYVIVNEIVWKIFFSRESNYRQNQWLGNHRKTPNRNSEISMVYMWDKNASNLISFLFIGSPDARIIIQNVADFLDLKRWKIGWSLNLITAVWTLAGIAVRPIIWKQQKIGAGMMKKMICLDSAVKRLMREKIVVGMLRPIMAKV